MATTLFNRHEEAIIRLAMARKSITPRMALASVQSIDSKALADRLIKGLVEKDVLSLQLGGFYSITAGFDRKIRDTLLNVAKSKNKVAFEQPVIKTIDTPQDPVAKAIEEKAKKAKANALKAKEKQKAESKAKAEAAKKKKAEIEAKRKATQKLKAEANAAKKEAERKAKRDEAKALRVKEKLEQEAAERKAKQEEAEALKAKEKLEQEAAERKAKQEEAEALKAKEKLEQEAAERKAKDEVDAEKLRANLDSLALTETGSEKKSKTLKKAFSKEDCLESAALFDSKTKWNLGNRNAYNAAKTNGWFDECTTHMSKNKPAVAKEVKKKVEVTPIDLALGNIRKLAKQLKINGTKVAIEQVDIKCDALETLTGIMPQGIKDMLSNIAVDLRQ